MKQLAKSKVTPEGTILDESGTPFRVLKKSRHGGRGTSKES